MTDPNSIEEVIKKQKEQCVFCKIIKGEIPSEKVYEDEDVLAIMDINPATDGHVLVMPKEHYPIMPLIPRKSFSHLFKIAKYIIIAQKEAFGSSTVSLFIANGGIAGQQSTHFMIHLIPRSAGDNLSMLDAYGSNDFDVRDIESILSPNLYAALLNHAQTNPDVAFFLEHLDKESSMTHNPESNVKPKSSHVPTDEQKKKISELFNNDEDFRKLLLENPDLVKEKINSDESWATLFQGIDVDALVEKLREIK